MAFISFLVVKFTCIQYFIGANEKKHQHLFISNKYSDLTREIEIVILDNIYNNQIIQNISDKFNQINNSSINIPESVIKNYESEYPHLDHRERNKQSICSNVNISLETSASPCSNIAIPQSNINL
jgi:hypothetical protein